MVFDSRYDSESLLGHQILRILIGRWRIILTLQLITSYRECTHLGKVS
ncbi:Uncharacterised protein [Vibrio cholerae]|nr:Uncharacterised protein [Vibrio cholerae]